MSRSYRKFPLFRYNLWGKSLKKGKRYNNRKIRRKLKDPNIDVGSGSNYKRFGLDSWDLWEYKFYETKQDAINKWKQDQIEIANGVSNWKNNYNTTLEETIKDWYKNYKRK